MKQTDKAADIRDIFPGSHF